MHKIFGVLGVAALMTAPAMAQTMAEESIESRFQLDFQVSDAAIKKFLPAGWDLNVATTGPATNCNLRVIFIDRIAVNAGDGKATGASQMVYLTVPVKNASGTAAQMVIGGLTSEAMDVPGPFGNYQAAASHEMKRSSTAAKGKGIIEEQTWSFSGAGGERFDTQVRYERVPAARARRDTTYVSAADPSKTVVAKIDNGINIARNATVQVPDKVQAFTYKFSGGKFASLFDGKEKVVSIDFFPWNNLSIAAK